MLKMIAAIILGAIATLLFWVVASIVLALIPIFLMIGTFVISCVLMFVFIHLAFAVSQIEDENEKDPSQ